MPKRNNTKMSEQDIATNNECDGLPEITIDVNCSKKKVSIFDLIALIAVAVVVTIAAMTIVPKMQKNWSFGADKENGEVIYDATVDNTMGGECNGGLYKWEIDADGVMTISGEGNMDNWGNWETDNSAPWCNNSGSIVEIIIEDGITSIGNFAFADCSSLKSITIPDSVRSIGKWAFLDCNKLTSIAIPTGVNSIDASALSCCFFLKEINVSKKNTAYKSIAGVLFNFETTELLNYPAGKQGNYYKITDGVTNIGDYAFYYCDELDNIIVPQGVKSIGDLAFHNCSSLDKLTLPTTVKSIGEAAFSCCSGLKKFTIPDGVTSIADEAFQGCNSLAEFTLSNSVKSIGNYAFWGCDSLTELTIPASVKSIGEDALTCKNIKSINVNVASTTFKSIDGVLFNYSVTELLRFPVKKVTESYIIPNSVKIIGECAFYNCGYINEVVIPNSVTSIGKDAFNGCSNLSNVTLPNSLTSIGAFAFANGEMSKITIPESVKYIGEEAFAYWGSTQEINISKDKNATAEWSPDWNMDCEAKVETY